MLDNLSPESDVQTMQLLRAVWGEIDTPSEAGSSPDVRQQSLHYARAIAQHLGLIPGNGPGMADVTFEVGTDSRDYSTITAWAADIDNGGLYSASDVAIGECYNDSAFDEHVTIDGGGTVGLGGIQLHAASGEQHDGTAGTGARVVNSSGGGGFASTTSIPCTVRLLEVDGNGQAIINLCNMSNGGVFRTFLAHGSSRAGSLNGMSVTSGSTDIDCLNNVVYDIESTGAGTAIGIEEGSAGTRNRIIANCTVQNIQSSSGSSYGINITNDGSGKQCTNCAVVTTGSTDFNMTLSTGTESYNLSEDASAAGTGSITSATAANQFVSTVGGSEDLHIQDTDADIFEAGTDLGTTPTGVNIDADGFDRNAGATTWSIGAFDGNELRGAATTALARSKVGTSLANNSPLLGALV